jgi:quercetin dioxygenase-like cupin family protein
MHVTPGALRVVRRGPVAIRFAMLESMAFVLAELPTSGSAGTSIEQPCIKPHWAFVIAGDVTFETEGRRQTIKPGSAFHVPAGGPPHLFRTSGPATIAGFEPIEDPVDASDSALTALGYEIMAPEAAGDASVIPATIEPLVEPRAIDARAWAMSTLVLTQGRFGPGSGYTTNWCDQPHWGMVTAGKLAIEWEDDVEILDAGDVYHCPAGPPGHRLEAADPASIVDLTPLSAFSPGTRMATWRRRLPDAAGPTPDAPIAVAGLG